MHQIISPPPTNNTMKKTATQKMIEREQNLSVIILDVELGHEGTDWATTPTLLSKIMLFGN